VLTASCSRIHYCSLAQGPGTPLAWYGVDLQIGDVHRRQYGTLPIKLGAQQVGRQCMKPTRLQLSLSVAAQHTESFDTMCSQVA
jgi:hypothetical protein